MNKPKKASEILEFLLTKDTTRSYQRDKFRIYFLSGDKVKATEYVNTLPEGFILTLSYIWLEKYDSALNDLETLFKMNPSWNLGPRYLSYYALSNYKMGNIFKAREIIASIVKKSNETTAGSPAFFTGLYYSGIGETDSAFYWLEKAYENRSVEFPWLKVVPQFDILKKDDRFWDLYERTGHKAYDEYLANKK